MGNWMRKHASRLLTGLVCWLSAYGAEPNPYRKWGYYGGRTVEGRLVRTIGQTVVIERRDGRRLAVSASFLSESDRRCLETGSEAEPAVTLRLDVAPDDTAERAATEAPEQAAAEQAAAPKQADVSSHLPRPAHIDRQALCDAARAAGLTRREAERIVAERAEDGSEQAFLAKLTAPVPAGGTHGALAPGAPVNACGADPRDILRDCQPAATPDALADGYRQAVENGAVSFAEFCAGYAALRQRGYAHRETLALLRELAVLHQPVH
ncbi:MAG: hypothetical protein JXR37_15190 [Kiritimatiellae bacterium]|nr:hypothetical protein [Kiritimatiellia bacterium]